jgi:hypothetical protein
MCMCARAFREMEQERANQFSSRLRIKSHLDVHLWICVAARGEGNSVRRAARRARCRRPPQDEYNLRFEYRV